MNLTEDKMLHGTLLCQPRGSCKVLVRERPDGALLLVPDLGETLEGSVVAGSDLLIQVDVGTEKRYRIISSEPSILANAVNIRVEVQHP